MSLIRSSTLQVRRLWDHEAIVTRAVRVLILGSFLFLYAAPTCIEETEFNNTITDADLLRFGEIGMGARTANDVDYWRLVPAERTNIAFVYVTAEESTLTTDTFIELLADDGTFLEEDDDDGPDDSSAIAGRNLPQDGSAILRVTSPVGGNISEYIIYQAIIDGDDRADETEDNDTAPNANPISASIMRGQVDPGFGDDWYRFRAVDQSEIVVIADRNPNGGSVSDMHIRILNGNGAMPFGSDDPCFAGGCDALVVGPVTAPSTGELTLRIDEFAGNNSPNRDYQFVVLINGVPYADADGDTFANTDDNCPNVVNDLQLDFDGDGVGDDCDQCPSDAIKTDGPGDCGCDEPDVDIDGDGVSDCGLADPARELLATFGLLLVADTDNDRIMAFDPADGDLVDADFIPADDVNLMDPVAAILGPNGDSILVSDATSDAIQEFDLDGNFLRTFAPNGGGDTTILDNPEGLAWRPNGNLVVCVTAGANANAVAEFDRDGNYLGNFIENGALGLDDPRHILFHSNGFVFVADDTTSVRIFHADGSDVNAYSALTDSGVVLQWNEAGDGSLLGAIAQGGLRGVTRFVPEEFPVFIDQLAPKEINVFTGVAELGNGNRLVTGGPVSTEFDVGGAFEVDPAGQLVRTIFRGPELGVVQFVIQDRDGDGTPDGFDDCPDDADKIAPGACGCGNPETDSDNDTVPDCDDQCDGADDTIDANDNGQPDCLESPAENPDPMNDDSNPDDNENQNNADGDMNPPGAQEPPTTDCCGGGMPMAMPLLLIGWRLKRRRRVRS